MKSVSDLKKIGEYSGLQRYICTKSKKTYNGVNFSVDIDFIPFVPIKHIFWLSVILTSVPKFSAPIVTFMASDDEILSLGKVKLLLLPATEAIYMFLSSFTDNTVVLKYIMVDVAEDDVKDVILNNIKFDMFKWFHPTKELVADKVYNQSFENKYLLRHQLKIY
jgi:hypothetical protein